jgi:hypothetical protein
MDGPDFAVHTWAAYGRAVGRTFCLWTAYVNVYLSMVVQLPLIFAMHVVCYISASPKANEDHTTASQIY